MTAFVKITADQSGIILTHRRRSVVQRRQGISLDIPDSGGGMAETVLDVFDVLPPQLQEAGTNQGCRNILPADTVRFLRGAGSFRHQLHITVKDVGVTGMVPDQSLIVNVLPDFFPDPSHLIHQIPAIPWTTSREARGLGEDMIGFSKLLFFLLGLIRRLIRAVQTASCGHSGLPGLGGLDCLHRSRKKSLIGGDLFLIPRRLHSLIGFVLRSRIVPAAGKILDIDHGRLSQALALALDEAEALQLPHEGGGPVVPAAEELLHIFLDEINEHPAQAVRPAVFGRQAHPVQHQAIERRGLQGKVAVKEDLGHAVKAELAASFP